MLVQMERQGLLGIKGIAKHSLDQSGIRRLLKENNAENWLQMLKDSIVNEQFQDIEVVFCFIQDSLGKVFS